MRCASAGARPRPGPACMRQMRRRLKNHARETAQFRARALLGFVIVVLALGGLAGWYFQLQVLDHADSAKRSEADRIKPRPRSEERRVGKECISTCRSRGSPNTSQKKTK